MITFAFALVIVQISCQKSNAQLDQTKAVNLILFHKANLYSSIRDSSGNVINYYWGNKYFTSDIDGNNIKLIPITLPTGLYANGSAYLSPVAKTIIFSVTGPPGGNLPVINDIYSCSIDGTNLKKIIIDGALNGVY